MTWPATTAPASSSYDVGVQPWCATAEQPVLLYRVRAGTATNFQKADPAARERDFPVIATIVATSAFVPSKFGDTQLYMRHHRGCSPVQPGAKTAADPSLCR